MSWRFYYRDVSSLSSVDSKSQMNLLLTSPLIALHRLVFSSIPPPEFPRFVKIGVFGSPLAAMSRHILGWGWSESHTTGNTCHSHLEAARRSHTSGHTRHAGQPRPDAPRALPLLLVRRRHVHPVGMASPFKPRQPGRHELRCATRPSRSRRPSWTPSCSSRCPPPGPSPSPGRCPWACPS